MALNRQLANLPDAITTDTSNNVGIGGSPSGSYKLDVTGTGRFTGNLTAAAFLGNLYTNTWYAGSGSTLSLRTAASGVIADFSPTTSNILGYVGINGSTASGAALSVYDTTSGSEQLRLCNSTGSGYWGIGRENNVTGDLYFNSGGTLRVTFKSGGNVGIGTSSPSSPLQIAADNSGGSTNYDNAQLWITGTNTAKRFQIGIDTTNNKCIIQGYYGGVSSLPLLLQPYGGNVLIGTTTDAGQKLQVTNAGVVGYFLNTTSNDTFKITNNSASLGASANILLQTTGIGAGTTAFFIYGELSGGTNTFRVYNNGNVQNSNNSYTAISDIKLKENIVDTAPKLEDLLKVRVVNYNLKEPYETHKQIGVIAQELEQIFPALVEETQDKDADTTTKSVKYSVFVPILIKAVQELQEQINELKNK